MMNKFLKTAAFTLLFIFLLGVTTVCIELIDYFFGVWGTGAILLSVFGIWVYNIHLTVNG